MQLVIIRKHYDSTTEIHAVDTATATKKKCVAKSHIDNFLVPMRVC